MANNSSVINFILGFAVSLFASLTFTQMEILSFAKVQADSYTGRKKRQNLHMLFLACPSDSGRDDVNGCKIDPRRVENMRTSLPTPLLVSFFSRFPDGDGANNWFLLCHQWCFSIKVHIEKCDEGAIMEIAIKWFLSNAIFFFSF